MEITFSFFHTYRLAWENRGLVRVIFDPMCKWLNKCRGADRLLKVVHLFIHNWVVIIKSLHAAAACYFLPGFPFCWVFSLWFLRVFACSLYLVLAWHTGLICFAHKVFFVIYTVFQWKLCNCMHFLHCSSVTDFSKLLATVTPCAFYAANVIFCSEFISCLIFCVKKRYK